MSDHEYTTFCTTRIFEPPVPPGVVGTIEFAYDLASEKVGKIRGDIALVKPLPRPPARSDNEFRVWRDLSPNGEFFLNFGVKALVTRSFATDIRPLFRDSDIAAMNTPRPRQRDRPSRWLRPLFLRHRQGLRHTDLPLGLRTRIKDHNAVRLANRPLGSPRLGIWLVGGSGSRLQAVDGPGDAAVMPSAVTMEDQSAPPDKSEKEVTDQERVKMENARGRLREPVGAY